MLERVFKFTPAEEFVWKQVRSGKLADFNETLGFGGELKYPDPEEAEEHSEIWSESRILRAEFLETLIIDANLHKNIVDFGIWIQGGWIKGDLDLSHRSIKFPLSFQNCRFEGGVELVGCWFHNMLALNGSWIKGTLNLNGVKVEQHIFMGGGGCFQKVNLSNAEIFGQLSLSGSDFQDTLNVSGANIKKGLFMRGGATFRDVSLANTRIGFQLGIVKAIFCGFLSINGARLDRMIIRRGVMFGGEVTFSNLHVSGQLEMSDATFLKKLWMSNMKVDGQCYLSNGITQEDSESYALTFKQDWQGCSFFDGLEAKNLTVGGDLFLRNTVTRSDLGFGFSLCKVGGSLCLGSQSNVGNGLPSIDFSGLIIEGELDLGTYSPISWKEEATLNLRNASVGNISAKLEDWPDNIKLDGFRYEHLGGLDYHEDRDPGKWNIGELKRWLNKQGTHSPDPYRQMARVLEKQGHTEKAAEVLYAGMEETRQQVKKDSKGQKFKWSFWWLSLQNLLVGYGFRKRRALAWMFGFWVLGVLILFKSGQAELLKMNFGLGYSLDMLMPIMRLNAMHYTKDFVLTNSWVRWYFYFHQIMGYVLVTFLIAGLSGVFKDKK